MNPRWWIVPHTHWDREWYLSFQDFRWKLAKAMDRIIDTLSAGPAFSHFMLDGQTVLLEDYLAVRPERRGELAELAGAGRLSVGPWYVQPDDILVTGEALIRNLERGMAEARGLAAGGGPMMIGYLPDSFGHCGTLPSILAGFGIECAAFMRGPGPTLDKAFFHWEGRDGSRVLVAYLIDGYGNGAELSMDAATIAPVLEELVERQKEALIPGVPVLVMNGIDHRSVDSELPEVLGAAGLQEAAVIGSLEAYVDAARAVLPAALPRWKGELRSVYRCPITVGCTSTRHWIKREDQAVATLLERRAEPLAALASLLGSPYPGAALDLAWRYLLLNQPHDSICGCSIDAVHDDMRYRYAQARGLAANIADDAARFIAGTVSASAAAGSTFVAVNPAPARTARCLSCAVAEVPPRPVLQDAAGVLFPVQAVSESGESALFFDERFKPAQLRLALGLVRNGEIMSYRISAARTSWESESVLRVDVTLAEGGDSPFDWNAWVTETLPLLNREGLSAIHAVGMRSGKTRIVFSAAVPAFGAKSFVLRSLGAAEQAPAGELLRSGKDWIENEHCRVRVQRDGCLELLDKRAARVHRGLGRLVDGGDRGDEYNFDAPAKDRIVATPRRRARTRLVESGPVRATLRVETVMRVPESIAKDRTRRSRKLVTLRIVRHVSLAAGASRVEIRTEVDNTARDHRLRVHFPVPGSCRESIAGGTFEVVHRGIGPEILPPRPTRGGVASDLSQEVPAATHPFTGFVATGTLAVLSRGSREYEVLDVNGRSELAVTLFRSVGWLSRSDLVSRSGHAGMDIQTPGAQERGRLTFQYAVTTGDAAGPSLPGEWEDYRSPAEVVAQAPGSGSVTETSLLDVQGTGITFSSLTRAPSGRLRLRFFEHAGKGGTLTVRSRARLRSAFRARIDGTRLEVLPLGADGLSTTVTVASYQILTLELEPAV